MLDKKILNGLKLVTNDEYFATDAEVEADLEVTFQQASQGWGVRRQQGVLLRMARDLKLALELAATAVDSTNKIKGLQLEGGRLKKQIAVLEGKLVAKTRSLDIEITKGLQEE